MRSTVLDLSLHILDIVENSINAGARRVRIELTENVPKDQLVVEISDDGKGMDESLVQGAADPFVTTRRDRRVGFGLPLFSEAAKRSGGEVQVRSKPDGGTRIRAIFGHSHIDRQPFGDMGKTLLILVAGHPDTEFRYLHRTGDGTYTFSSRDVLARLKDRSITSPEGLRLLRETVRKSLPIGSHQGIRSA